MPKREWLKRLIAALATITPSLAYSCPLCHTQIGEQVRAGIFNDNFGSNLLATILPFPVFAGLVAYMYFSNPGKHNHSSDDSNDE